MECKEQRSRKESRRGSAKHVLVGSLEGSLESGGETYLRARDMEEHESIQRTQRIR